ncbi:hypothetical protein [Bacillus massiliglaciei]|uniref:hypothetical protein n=1 Tax=Bacillus massiliglaciei TaxID=1816693 RepID=UPI000DA61742|nr:hypothetical protein [Bacillus massiliglaciei]
MKKNTWASIASILLVMGLGACSGDQDGEAESSSPNQKEEPAASNSKGNSTETDSSENPAKDRPKEKSDTIQLEGIEESFQFILHDSPRLGFSTYIVQDLLVEEESSEEGNTMNVYANFAGQKNKDARVQIFAKSAGTNLTAEEQTELAKEAVKSDGFKIEERTDNRPNRFSWSESEFDIAKENSNEHTIVGTVSIFQHSGRYYYAIVHYPVEFEEGFIPRIVKMFEEMEWYETE